MYFGNVCHRSLPMPARPVPGRTQPSPELKALLPLHLLPGFHDMDRINKSLSSSGLRLSSPLRRKVSACSACRLRFNSMAQASAHYSGTRHAKRMKALDAPDSKIRTSEPVATETASQHSSSEATSEATNPSSQSTSLTSSPSETLKEPYDQSLNLSPSATKNKAHKDEETEAPDRETEEEKALRLLYCSLCKVAVNSASQLQAHNSGTKHKTMLEARNGHGAIKSFPRSGIKAKTSAPPESSTGLQNKTFHCEICDVHVNSETQLKQHISSRRHKDRAAGKPAKPKFSPYTSTQRHTGLQAIRLALQKQDVSKPLPPGLLQRQISVAAAMASLSAFPLQHATNCSPALFPSQSLPQALLHPASGPICSAHTSVLFSPF